MGCGASTVKAEPEKAPPPILAAGVFTTSGSDPDAIKLSTKIRQVEEIRVNCGSIFVAAHPDNEIDCLMLYPDARIIKGDASQDVNPMNMEGSPQWKKGPRVQMKEFDSIDDVYKDWFENGHTIPGVSLVEDAGAMGGWVRLSPHHYQHRYILPDGRRMWSPKWPMQGWSTSPSRSASIAYTRNMGR